MQEMLKEDNFVYSEKILAKNKPDNRMAQYISKHAESFGKQLFNKVCNGKFQWHKPKETTITESYKGKERHLKIPCLEDQAAQIAWLNVASPIIQRRNYYYNCGSIPNAGQKRAVLGLQKWLKNPRMKYGAVSDIRKFYDTCPHSAIRNGLCRIFKDKAFVEYIMGAVASMSDNGIGIAIGYPVSHWLANVALMWLDHAIKRNFPDVHFAKYMDDVAMASTNKRHLKKALYFLKRGVESMQMRLKKWAHFAIKGRGISFLSYRFFNGYTLLIKDLMIRISRRVRNAPKHMCAHVASGIISCFGILKYCDSFNFRKSRVYPYINRRTCLKLISEKGRKQYASSLCC